jgi:hypothetical protein
VQGVSWAPGPRLVGSAGGRTLVETGKRRAGEQRAADGRGEARPDLHGEFERDWRWRGKRRTGQDEETRTRTDATILYEQQRRGRSVVGRGGGVRHCLRGRLLTLVYRTVKTMVRRAEEECGRTGQSARRMAASDWVVLELARLRSSSRLRAGGVA